MGSVSVWQCGLVKHASIVGVTSNALVVCESKNFSIISLRNFSLRSLRFHLYRREHRDLRRGQQSETN